MGIYIPGMEMPTRCEDCPCFYPEYNECNAIVGRWVDGKGTPPSDCPLIPVPAHGRVVDADKLEETMDFALQQVNAYLDNLDADYYSAEYREMEARAQCYRDALASIRAAQTVIPEGKA